MQRSCRKAGVSATATSRRTAAPAQSRGPAVASRPGTGAGRPGSAARESRAECRRTETSATGRGPAVASHRPRQPASLHPAPGRYRFPEASTNSTPHSESSLSQPLLDSPKSPFTDSPHPPILWRSKFTEDVASQLVSWSNPDGIINNSELELAGEVTTATGTDNTAAHSWATKGAELLEYFNRTYPQAVPSQIRELSPAMHEALNSALLCKRAPPEALDVVLKPVDEPDTGFPQGLELPVSAASHGFRQRLYEQFALRPKSWTDRRPTPS
ncbi:hypothetical protein THAOC_06869 [Thalassiosira oceanica]|uniref:Uncharacterized protein n=1 Tax=Thalassiosira oceanica TaxID=159749 RepID=K0T3I0_THAOC|nr:hypothetical protein THAOC_06869 [Thalassiosira oceanica]|eukprot:EJK71669.1 hypothetical protein THAOC_06869 [Thalassiosira oceanica]